MFRMTAFVFLAALVIVSLGCAAGGIPRIDPCKEGELKSPPDDVEVTLIFQNKRESMIQVEWLDYDGKRKPYLNVKAGKEARQVTYEGHYWIVLDDKGKPLGIYKTPSTDGVIVVK